MLNYKTQINKTILWRWVILAILISFDNIYSYFAIVYHGMREWNKITAFFVSLNPLFYFVSIPITFLFIYLLIKLGGLLTVKFEKSSKKMKELTEKIILTSLIISWSIGVSLFNLISLLRGFSPLRVRYEIFLVAGILTAIIYGIYAGYRIKKKRL